MLLDWLHVDCLYATGSVIQKAPIRITVFSGSWIPEWLDCNVMPVPSFWGFETIWRCGQGSDPALLLLCLVLWPLRCLNAPDFGNTVVMVCLHMKELVKFRKQFSMIYKLNLINFCEQIKNISVRNSSCVEYIFQSSKFGQFFLYNYLFKMELVLESMLWET